MVERDLGRKREKDSQADRQTVTETEADRQRDRQRGRQTVRVRESVKHAQTEWERFGRERLRQRETNRWTESERERDRQTHRHTDRRKECTKVQNVLRHRDIHVDKYKESQRNKNRRMAGRWTDKEIAAVRERHF